MPSKETGLICTGESVRGILDGRKTQTRRIVKLEYYKSGLFFRKDKYNTVWFGDTFPVERYAPENILKYCPYGQVGDRLYLQEAYRVCNNDLDRKQAVMVHYYSDRSYHSVGLTDAEWALWLKRKKPFAKTSGRFMYKSLARIWLEIIGIKVERVQNISQGDAKAEGIIIRNIGETYWRAFRDLWDSINAKRGYPWQTNPWVWVLEFRKAKD